jgi:hypothetical protein
MQNGTPHTHYRTGASIKSTTVVSRLKVPCEKPLAASHNAQIHLRRLFCFAHACRTLDAERLSSGGGWRMRQIKGM